MLSDLMICSIFDDYAEAMTKIQREREREAIE